MLKVSNHHGNAIETKMRSHLSLVKMTISKKMNDNKCCQGYRE